MQYHEGVRARWLAKKRGQSYKHPYDLGIVRNMVTVSGHTAFSFGKLGSVRSKFLFVLAASLLHCWAMHPETATHKQGAIGFYPCTVPCFESEAYESYWLSMVKVTHDGVPKSAVQIFGPNATSWFWPTLQSSGGDGLSFQTYLDLRSKADGLVGLGEEVRLKARKDDDDFISLGHKPLLH